MPMRPKRLCLHPGCRTLVERGYCTAHQPSEDADRPSAAKRGYGHRWRVYRTWFLARHPICAACQREAATDVDHIHPVSGPDDPAFWSEENHQALCHACHALKTATRDGGYGRPKAPAPPATPGGASFSPPLAP